MATVLGLIFIALAAFIPAILLTLLIKNTERHEREPTGRTMLAFLRGATLSVGIAILIEFVLVYLVLGTDILRMSELLGRYPHLGTLILACVIAPFAEEFTKLIGMYTFTKRATELEDGIVYGAAVGLGFAATENMLYETSSYLADEGIAILITMIIIRTASSALLHASCGAITGFGLTAKRFRRVSWVPYFLLAVLLHGVFNLVASLGPLLEGTSIGTDGYLIGLVAAITIGVGAFVWTRRKISVIDMRGILG